jgi:hypothetical protein
VLNGEFDAFSVNRVLISSNNIAAHDSYRGVHFKSNGVLKIHSAREKLVGCGWIGNGRSCFDMGNSAQSKLCGVFEVAQPAARSNGCLARSNGCLAR